MAVASNASQIQNLFNRIATTYDSLNDWLSLGQHRIWKQMTVKWAAPKPGDRALDLCCGSGDLARLLAQAVGSTGQVFGVDFASALLEVAQRRTQACYPPLAITWVEANVLSLPFPENSFDVATMGYGLRNVIDIPQSLKEVHRVLKPGARAAILDFNHPSHPWVQSFQRWYLATIVVPAAQQQGLTDEYAYISPSLDRFPTGAEQVHLARQSGFTQATHYPIAGGTMGVLVLTKS